GGAGRVDVHAVDDSAGDLHRLGAGADLAGGDLLGRRVLAVSVVLADQEQRQRGDLREVHAFEEVRLVGGAVAEVGDDDPAAVAQREPDPGRGGDRAADDAEAADQAVVEVDHVHRAGPTTVDPGLAAEQLGEQALRLEPQRERVPVSAVGAGDAVVA